MRVVLAIAWLVLLTVAALAEDLSKLNGYAVVFGVASSSAENLAKLNAYAVVGGGASPSLPTRGLGSLSLGIN